MIVGRLTPVAAALDLAGALHEIAPRQPILLAAALADDLDAKALIAHGIADVVPWPIIIGETARALHARLRYSDRGEPLSHRHGRPSVAAGTSTDGRHKAGHDAARR
jgi:hypothetical protein